jgi:hypothetical protein
MAGIGSLKHCSRISRSRSGGGWSAGCWLLAADPDRHLPFAICHLPSAQASPHPPRPSHPPHPAQSLILSVASRPGMAGVHSETFLSCYATHQHGNPLTNRSPAVRAGCIPASPGRGGEKSHSGASQVQTGTGTDQVQRHRERTTGTLPLNSLSRGEGGLFERLKGRIGKEAAEEERPVARYAACGTHYHPNYRPLWPKAE